LGVRAASSYFRGVVRRKTTIQLRRAYELMRARFGHLHWWPGETPFEVCVGAILTQNTAWSNVERAITNLKNARALAPKKLFALSEIRLARLIKPAGYFNVKARRLRSFLHVLVEEHDADLNQLFAGDTAQVRQRLLAIHGIGPETADSLLLYGGGHHSFVIDAYTRRIFQRHNWEGRRPKAEGRKRNPDVSGSDFTYDALKSLCESSLNHTPHADRLDYWQDYHAQLVMVGKHFCRPRQPRCEQCPLRSLLPAVQNLKPSASDCLLPSVGSRVIATRSTRDGTGGTGEPGD
jgi:endonuclease-3 related protein